MRTALLTVVIFGPLAALASNPERGLEGDIQDGPGTPTPGSFGDGTALYEQWPQLGSVPVNRTEGFIRREKRQPKNLLEARQTDVSYWFHFQSVICNLCQRRANLVILTSHRISDIGVLGSRLHSSLSCHGSVSMLRPKIPHLCAYSAHLAC